MMGGEGEMSDIYERIKELQEQRERIKVGGGAKAVE